MLVDGWGGDWAQLGAIPCPALEQRLPAFSEDLRRQWRAKQEAPPCWGAFLGEDEFIST